MAVNPSLGSPRELVGWIFASALALTRFCGRSTHPTIELLGRGAEKIGTWANTAFVVGTFDEVSLLLPASRVQA